ncbi:rhomboid family intramembrane serine protease [Aureibaculum sp. 2210JD6-5]|uniref:rhomboid family intramembrane serine protease n=1 Tax=Aureibaculum sp. 2210JD6-5 TaxID=3103957 RepID=UPI002AAEA368|nr:rhomboid family intramembrane serine protease [Aureibaculum sp. 2210JD6-5]MDY7393622.1 rhomboid family intramembrane serine protease [Aureibaculum sp. 2210JD6-5]
MNHAVIALIVINVLVSIKGFSDRLFFERYKFQIGPILNGEQIRMFTSGFLHVDQAHLFFNMFALYIFADPVIDHLGILKFVIIYLGSLLAGSTLALSFHKKDPYYSAVGASGAVMGIIYAGIMLNPDMRLTFIFFPFFDIPGYVFGVGYLLYSIYGMKKQLGNIGHSAHLGGAVGGFVLTLALYPQIFIQNKIIIIILAFPIILMFVFKNKLINK